MTRSRPRESLLVETDWLAARLGDPALRVVDIRGVIKPPNAPKPWYLAQLDAYRQSHIPGAVFVDWTGDIVEPTAPVHMTVAGLDRFKVLMERLGIGDGHTVVVYDDTGTIAPRLWWVLNYYGHPEARLLNGGWTKWVAEGRPVTADAPAHPAAVFTPRVCPEWRVGTAEVKAALNDPGVALVDCRSPKEFVGEIGRGERKGRIPGAVNVPVGRCLDPETKTWKAPGEIRKLFEAAGVTPDRRVITYCNAGVSASVGLFALKLLGYEDATNFAGSWYEWETDPTNPVQAGR
ncbi:MAG: sulfurtransferase [Candidatus Rokubacteria bacterium]|nr:sulfurtransferase [Candidatus Rokubacteria bacterium]